jgi:hypothetical protein
MTVFSLTALLASTAALAGPPFRTDDAEPVEYHHGEFFVFSEATHVHGNTEGSLAGFELNYGILPEMQLSLAAPFAFDKAAGTDTQFGYGDTKISAKYRLIKEDENGWRPQVSIFPEIDLPTGDSDKDLGEGHTREFFPLWLQKSRGPWTSYGGGGYWINPGGENKDYWFFGWVLMRKVTDRMSVGGEVFHQTADTLGGVDSTGFNLGITYDVTKNDHFLFSAGRGIKNAAATNEFSYYIAYERTF